MIHKMKFIIVINSIIYIGIFDRSKKKTVVLIIVLIITLQESELIHIILYNFCRKNIGFSYYNTH